MAIINCPECGKEISDQATSCPNCGMPMLIESAWESTKTTSASSQNNDLLHCPKCNSTNLHTGKKGFSGEKALAGAVVAGGIGILAGTIGSHDIEVTCLKCGHKFNPVKDLKKEQNAEQRQKVQANVSDEFATSASIIMLLVFGMGGAIAAYNLFANEWYFFGVIFSLVTLFCIVMLIAFLIPNEKKQPPRPPTTGK